MSRPVIAVATAIVLVCGSAKAQSVDPASAAFGICMQAWASAGAIDFYKRNGRTAHVDDILDAAADTICRKQKEAAIASVSSLLEARGERSSRRAAEQVLVDAFWPILLDTVEAANAAAQE